MTAPVIDGSLAEWQWYHRLDAVADGAVGYALYGQFSGGNYVFAISAPVAITNSTTIWLDTDLSTATGYQVFGTAVGAEYNINIVGGLPYLYTGAAAQNFVSGPLTYAFSGDSKILEVSVPASSIGSTTALRVFIDVNDSVFLPNDYTLTGYKVEALDVVVSDSFTGTNGTQLASHATDTGNVWTLRTGNLEIQSNKLVSNTHPSIGTLSALVPASADYDVSVDVTITNAQNAIGVTGRHSTSDTTFYHFRWLNNNYELYLFVSGSPTLLGTVAGALSVSDVVRLRLRMRGSTISGWANGVSKISVTDTTIATAGVPGFRNNNSAGDASYDNYEVATPWSGATNVTCVQTRHSDADTFGTSVVSPGSVTLVQTRLNDADAFGTSVVTRSTALVHTLFVDADTFGGGVVSPGSVTLVQVRFDNTALFGADSFITAAAPPFGATSWITVTRVAANTWTDIDAA